MIAAYQAEGKVLRLFGKGGPPFGCSHLCSYKRIVGEIEVTGSGIVARVGSSSAEAGICEYRVEEGLSIPETMVVSAGEAMPIFVAVKAAACNSVFGSEFGLFAHCED